MRVVINSAGDRIVDATAEETHALRPAIRAAFCRWRASEADIEDLCQQVELITWQTLSEGRVHVPPFTRPDDALWQWMYAVAWNLWRNHCRRRWLRYEVLTDELPDVASYSPMPQLEARSVLRRISMNPRAAGLLLASIDGQRGATPRSTLWHRVAEARKWARDIEAGPCRKPQMPEPAMAKHQKKKR